MSPPYGMPLEHAKAQGDACQFHLNKILSKAKDAGADEKANQRKFVACMKAVNQKMVAYVKSNFKTGLEWNPKGVELSDYKPGAAAPAAAPAAAAAKAAAPAPAAAPAKKEKKAGALGNVFGELSKRAGG